MMRSISSERSTKVKPSKAVWVESSEVGSAATSRPMAGSTDMATPSEQRPTQERSCKTAILGIMRIPDFL